MLQLGTAGAPARPGTPGSCIWGARGGSHACCSLERQVRALLPAAGEVFRQGRMLQPEAGLPFGSAGHCQGVVWQASKAIVNSASMRKAVTLDLGTLASAQFLEDWTNRWWSRFFCLSVYVTMYLNDHQRSAFYESLGLNTTQFNRRASSTL